MDIKTALEHSVLFLRFFIFAVALQYWVLNDKRFLTYILYSVLVGFIFFFIDTFYQFLHFDLTKG